MSFCTVFAENMAEYFTVERGTCSPPPCSTDMTEYFTVERGYMLTSFMSFCTVALTMPIYNSAVMALGVAPLQAHGVSFQFSEQNSECT